MTDPRERERERMERGATLSDHAEPWRSSKHPGSGMECERSVFVGKKLLSEWCATALEYGVPDDMWADFYRGWWLASEWRPRPSLNFPLNGGDYPTDATIFGWDCYPHQKWVDPWGEPMDPKEQTRNDIDDWRRKLRGSL